MWEPDGSRLAQLREQSLERRKPSSVSTGVVTIPRGPPGTEQGLRGRLSKELMTCTHWQNSRIKEVSETVQNQELRKGQGVRWHTVCGEERFLGRAA